MAKLVGAPRLKLDCLVGSCEKMKFVVFEM